MKPENFFQLNLPYGMEKDPFTNEWTLFNTDHSPMGFYTADKVGCERYPLFSHHYYGLSDRFLYKLVDGREDLIQRDRQEKINRIYFYDIHSHPFPQGKVNVRNWRQYTLILQEIGHLKVRIRASE